MRVLDLFSGIGGFSLGLERAGMETIAFCEIDPFCRQVLAKHWPDIPIHEDITRLDGEQYRGTVDVVCGGFPCQPHSLAGKRAGSSDDRALWPEMHRIICEVQPTWVIGENVAGLNGVELDALLSNLELEDYACQTFDIPACGIGAHHIRHRLWVVAHANEAELWEQSGGRSGPGRSQEVQPKFAGESVGDADSQWKSQPQRRIEKSWRRFSDPGWREAFTRVCRTTDGVPNRLDRIGALGNAVVPQIPEILGSAIMALES